MTLLSSMLAGGALFLGLYLAFGSIIPIGLGAVLFALVCLGAWSDWQRAHRTRPRDARGRFVAVGERR